MSDVAVGIDLETLKADVEELRASGAESRAWTQIIPALIAEVERLRELSVTLLTREIDSVATALPEMFKHAAKTPEGLAIWDQINADIITARKELAHLAEALPPPREGKQ